MHDMWAGLDIMDDSSIDTDSNNSENQRQRRIAEHRNMEVISISSGSVDEPLFQEESVFDVSTEGQTSEVSNVSSDDGFLCQFCGEPSGCDCIERGYKM